MEAKHKIKGIVAQLQDVCNLCNEVCGSVDEYQAASRFSRTADALEQAIEHATEALRILEGSTRTDNNQ